MELTKKLFMLFMLLGKTLDIRLSQPQNEADSIVFSVNFLNVDVVN